MGETYTIYSLWTDGRIKRSWQCELLKRNGPQLEFLGVFDLDVSHAHLGQISKGTFSFEFYWLDKCYNVFRFHEPDGTFRNFYCNINMPPVLGDGVLEYIDLDIDIVVDPAGNVSILDEDEFEENSRAYNYEKELIVSARDAVDSLLGMIERRDFPFDLLKLPQQNRPEFVSVPGDLEKSYGSRSNEA